jgi:hypothetical protein
MASSIDASTSGAGGVITTADNTGILQLKTAGTTAVTVNASQNVGIGTASPLAGDKLTISGGYGTFLSGASGTEASLSVGRTTTDLTLGVAAAAANYFSGSVAGDAAIAFGSGNLLFGSGNINTAGTERMRIDSSGNLLVGTTSTSTSTRGWKTLNSGSNTIIGENDTGNVDMFEFYRGTAGSLVRVGNIRTNGTNTTYTTSSDYRLKDNIAPIIGALDKVALLKPVTYTWKQDGSDGQGFIAHELQEVIPDCVTGEKDDVETYTDEDGIEQTRIKPQGIDTSFLVATLTAAIQEQQTIINDLKARIETLEAK